VFSLERLRLQDLMFNTKTAFVVINDV